MDEKQKIARRRLLEEGARSYLDAVNALIAFRQDVQAICKAVLEKHVDEYGSALNIHLADHDIQDHESPALKDWAGDWWNLGAKLVRKEITPAIRWWETYCCLGYGLDDGGLCCWVGEWFPTKQQRLTLHRRFHLLNKKVEEDGSVLFILQKVEIEGICKLEAYLNGIVEEWIALWRKVGGMKKVFSE
jgi:hypothetical protein